MNEEEQRTYDRLLDKSQEAFLLAIELYNRPTIRYHVEGCSFFICNAWELMLKAYLVREDGSSSIYYPSSERTLSLADCLKKVITNENDPLRLNLKVVNDLRNTSTHFVTDEYEIFYGPILQECVKYYDEKLRDLHGIEISDRIPENYLALSVRRGDVDIDVIRARYSKEVVDKMLTLGSSVLAASPGGSIGYATELRMTKSKNADFTFRIDNDSEQAVAVLHSLTNPINKFKYRTKTGKEFIQRKLAKNGTVLKVNGEKKEFNSYHFGLFVDFYEMKSNEAYSYNFALEGEQPSYGYSQQAIDLILQEVEKNPDHIVERIREELKKRKK